MKLTRAGLWGQICLLVLACLCGAAPVWAAPKDKGVVVVNNTTTVTGLGNGNGNATGNGNANGGTNGQGILNGNGNAFGFNTGSTSTSTSTSTSGSTQGSVVLTSTTSSTNGTTTNTGGTGSVSTFVSAVPEPGDYALMLTGLAMLGAAVRHRRRAAASSPALSALA